MASDAVAKARALEDRMRARARPREGDAATSTPDAEPHDDPMAEVEVVSQSAARRKRKPARVLSDDKHPQMDFFTADFVDVAQKNDRHSMEHPLFSLKKRPDTKIRVYEHNDVEITITPSVLGLATIWDKDLLIYATSQLVQGINEGRTDAVNRTVRFTAYDYFVSTNRGTSGAEYESLERTLERLKGTQIKTNIATGGERRKRGFGMIEDWEIVERGRDGKMVAIELTLSKWLYNAVQALEVLTINKDYFRLTGGLEKRLYELARKHCGNQALWTVGEEILFKKSGSTGTLREFRRLLKEIIQADCLPDYRAKYDEKARRVVFYTKNMRQLTATVLEALDKH
ncbi:replication initiator protein A [Caballeronia calidae]|uniref:Replication initiator protein A n=1 Tax=Caballeronia calidae TaxID=1777139 RepID=A0A158EH64_9BURK|nr:replication initiator protein A [Caballeronia calidae]SAL05756.1 replication initiator protein A [Caballeronia calidae]